MADVRVVPVSSLVTVTWAPVSDAFDESVTLPEMLPVVDWARPGLVVRRNVQTRRAALARLAHSMGRRSVPVHGHFVQQQPFGV